MISKLSTRRRWILPALISVGLMAWLLCRVSPARLLQAAEQVNWPALIGLTALMILAVYAWDVVCVRWLYTWPDQELSYAAAADVRAHSYLLSAFNYEAGQGALAWKLSQIQKTPLAASLSRCVVLAVHDLVLLLTLALVGSAIDPAPQTRYVPVILAGLLGVLALAAVAWHFLPTARRERILQTRWGGWLAWWRWRHSILLLLLRLIYFGIMIVYGGVALRMCGVARDFDVLCGMIPLVMLFDALPSVSGFGTRHAVFEALLDPGPAEKALVFSTFWSTGLLVGRAGIGLSDWWLLPLFRTALGRESA